MAMLPEFGHFKILERKRLGQALDNGNRNKGVTDRIKANRTTAFLTSLILNQNS